MLEKEIIQLLKKISVQLEEIAQHQSEIKSEIFALQRDVGLFHENTLKDLEERFQKDIGTRFWN